MGQWFVVLRGLSRGPHQSAYKSPGQISTVVLFEQSGALNAEHPGGALVKRQQSRRWIEATLCAPFVCLKRVYTADTHTIWITQEGTAFIIREKVNSEGFTTHKQHFIF